MEILVAAASVSLVGLATVLAMVEDLERVPAGSRNGVVALLLAAYGATIWLLPAIPTVTNLGVVAAATALGYLLGKVLGTSGAIVAFCTTAIIVDLLSFSGGLTRQILDRAAAGDDNVLQYLALVWPIGGRLTPVIGLADLAIAAALLRGLRHAGYPRRDAVMVLAIAIVVALTVGVAIGGAAGVPFIGGATMAYIGIRSWRRAPAARLP